MSQLQSKISDIGPVYYSNESKKTAGVAPNVILFNNITLMWDFLELTVKDWQREASPYQEKINGAKETNRIVHVGRAFMELQSYALKCIFSYAMFFVSLDKAYDTLYEQINHLNSKPFLQVKHDGKPHKTDYIEKVKKVRDISISHIDSKKGSKLDALAAIQWQPMSLSGPIDDIPNIDNLSFGGFTSIIKDSHGKVIEQSSDFEIKGVIEMHKYCSEYLDKYDKVCATYLTEIKARLPAKDSDDTLYSNSR